MTCLPPSFGCDADDLESGVDHDTSREHVMTSRTEESHVPGAEHVRVSYRPPAPKSALHIAPGDPVMDKPLPKMPQVPQP